MYNADYVTLTQMAKWFGPHGYNSPSSFIGVGKNDTVPIALAYNNAASDWIALNVLQLSPGTVMVEALQVKLAKKLKRHGFEVVLVPMPFARDFSGSLHCVTCPLHRGRQLMHHGTRRRRVFPRRADLLQHMGDISTAAKPSSQVGEQLESLELIDFLKEVQGNFESGPRRRP